MLTEYRLVDLITECMVIYTTSKTDRELAEILALQQSNLPENLPQRERLEQGFVTVSHSMEDLKKMNDYEQHVIVKDESRTVGYLLAMTKKSRADIPVLIPMFDVFDTIQYSGKKVSDYNYIVVGQVCIHKDYRGRGLLDNSYAAYRNYFNKKYDFAITEIATANQRSIRAHLRIGFFEIHRYIDPAHTEWSIVIWDWNI